MRSGRIALSPASNRRRSCARHQIACAPGGSIDVSTRASRWIHFSNCKSLMARLVSVLAQNAFHLPARAVQQHPHALFADMQDIRDLAVPLSFDVGEPQKGPLLSA